MAMNIALTAVLLTDGRYNGVPQAFSSWAAICLERPANL